MNRIKDKINEIEDYLYKLFDILPEGIEGYKNDHKTKAACERYFELIIESCIDLGFLIVKEGKLRSPEDSEKIFDVLESGNIISSKLSERLKDAKGMRNILSHQYGYVDDSIVFESISSELESDIREFLTLVKVFLDG